LRPPLSPLKKDSSNYFQCHQPPPSNGNSIDRKLFSSPMDERVKLLREYFGFFLLAGGIFLLVLNYRCVLDFCFLRNVTARLRKLRRFLCGRLIVGQQQRLMEEDRGEMEGRLPWQPRGIVVETVHTSLTYRLVRQCIQCQQRR
uniref:RING-type domain-containing protein n=1 Tax=Hymenolepis diminuta TaxID=6216 RepID=A0A0R3SXV1_HYMDI